MIFEKNIADYNRAGFYKDLAQFYVGCGTPAVLYRRYPVKDSREYIERCEALPLFQAVSSKLENGSRKNR